MLSFPSTLLRYWVRYAVVLTLLFPAAPGHAIEFIQAQKTFAVWGPIPYVSSGEEAFKASVAYYCADQECQEGEYKGERVSSSGNSWVWYGTYYVKTNGGWNPMHLSAAIDYGCPTGWTTYQLMTNPGRCSRNDKAEPPCNSCPDDRTSPQVGNPIVVNGGLKVQREIDYRNASGSLEFVRTYRSDDGTWRNNYQIFGVDFQATDHRLMPEYACVYGINNSTGDPWCFGYAGKDTPNSFGLRRGADRLIYFGTATDYSPGKDINDRVAPVLDTNGDKVAWQVTNNTLQTIELFSLTGHLQSITDRNGQVTTFLYSDATTPMEIAAKAGLLLQVKDPYGSTLRFTYNGDHSMATMLDPEGRVTAYAYDNKGNLTKVTYPDGKSKIYVYNELAYTSNVAQRNLLTGIIDENGDRYATFSYYSDRLSKSTEHAGSVEKYTLAYQYGSLTTVMSPLNAKYDYSYYNTVGVLRLSSMTRPAASGTGTVTARTSYDANANISAYKDFDGTQTVYTYDLTRNLETKRVEASGTAVARTISTEWHATFRLPLRIAEPLRRTTYTHDAAGNVLTKSVQATTDANGAAGFNATLAGTPRTWTYTYSTLGQLLTVTGPRTDVTDTTTYAYDEQGNLSTVTNALGHVTTLSNYDAHGRAGRVTDPNGLVTDFSYTPRGKLASTTAGGATTSYTYDNAGQLTGVSMPGGATLTYTYDPAHRLTAISDSAGNSVQYTLDNMGNRTSEQVKDGSGTLLRQIARVYDPLNRLKQITGAQQ